MIRMTGEGAVSIYHGKDLFVAKGGVLVIPAELEERVRAMGFVREVVAKTPDVAPAEASVIELAIEGEKTEEVPPVPPPADERDPRQDEYDWLVGEGATADEASRMVWPERYDTAGASGFAPPPGVAVEVAPPSAE